MRRILDAKYEKADLNEVMTKKMSETPNFYRTEQNFIDFEEI